MSESEGEEDSSKLTIDYSLIPLIYLDSCLPRFEDCTPSCGESHTCHKKIHPNSTIFAIGQSRMSDTKVVQWALRKSKEIINFSITSIKSKDKFVSVLITNDFTFFRDAEIGNRQSSMKDVYFKDDFELKDGSLVKVVFWNEVRLYVIDLKEICSKKKKEKKHKAFYQGIMITVLKDFLSKL